MTTIVDLTPFGFTSTESRVYNSLLDLGPSSGYAIAQALGLARANTYHALSSLRDKGAISVLGNEPLRVRAVRPDGLAALIGTQFSERLAVLDEQIRQRGEVSSGETVIAIATERSLIELATRMIAREQSLLSVAAPPRFYSATGPAWRKRQADKLPSDCWVYGGAVATLPVEAREVSDAAVIERFGPGPVLLATDSSAIWASWVDGVMGWWTQEQLSIGLVRASIANVGVV